MSHVPFVPICFGLMICCLFGTLPPAEAAPTELRRAIYVQVNSTKSGQFVFSANASWAQFGSVLGSEWTQDVLVYYLNKYSFNTISLYNVHATITNSAMTVQFRALLRKLRSEVTTLRSIEGIADDYLPAWTQMATYQNASTDPNEMFDGFVTEIEFWAQGDPTPVIDALTHMQQVALPKQRIPGTSLHYAVYLGHVSQSSVTQLVESDLVDLMMFHCYVKSPTTCGSYTATRRGYLQVAETNYTKGQNTTSRTNGSFAIILSAEGLVYRAGGESFSGDWMFAIHQANESADIVAVSEETATESLGDYSSSAPLLRFQGYQAYEYCFYAVYSGDAMPQADWSVLLAPTTTTTTTTAPPVIPDGAASAGSVLSLTVLLFNIVWWVV